MNVDIIQSKQLLGNTSFVLKHLRRFVDASRRFSWKPFYKIIYLFRFYLKFKCPTANPDYQLTFQWKRT